MIKHGKIIKMISLILLGIGIVLLAVGLMTGGKPGFAIIRNVNNGKIRIVTEIDQREKILEKTQIDKFENIKIDTDYKDIIFKESDDYYIEYKSSNNTGVAYEVKNGTLYISDEQNTNFFNFFNVTIKKFPEYVTVYVPKEAKFGEVNLNIYEGNLTIGNVISSAFHLKQKYGEFQGEYLQAKDVGIDMYEGKITIKDLVAGDVDVKTKYGDLTLEKATIQEENLSSGSFEANVYEGNIKFKEITGKTLVLGTKYANISGEQLEFSKVKATTYEGYVEIVELKLSSLDLKSKYGNVSLGLAGSENDYSFDSKAKYGSIYINNKDNGEAYSSTGNLKNEIIISSYEGDQLITTK